MKKTLTILLIAICGVALSAPVRSMTAARQAVIGAEQEGPPRNKQLEYIESTGKQWIDLPTSGVAGQYYGISGHVLIRSAQNNKSLFEDYQSSSGNRQFYSTGYSLYDEGTTYTLTSAVGGNASNGGWSVYVGEMTYFIVSTTGRTKLGEFIPLSRPLKRNFTKIRLCCFFRSTSPTYAISICIGDLQIKSGDTVEYDFVAWIDENGVACLHDKISGNNYYSIGSEDFVAGPVKEIP